MPRSLTSVVLLGAVAFASCTPAEVSPGAHDQRYVERVSHAGEPSTNPKANSTAALKTLKEPPAAISLHQEPNITADRRAEALAGNQ